MTSSDLALVFAGCTTLIAIGGVWATLRFRIEKKAISESSFVETNADLKMLEPRVRKLEDDHRDLKGQVNTIDLRTEKMDTKMDRNNDTMREMLGEFRAGGGDRGRGR